MLKIVKNSSRAKPEFRKYYCITLRFNLKTRSFYLPSQKSAQKLKYLSILLKNLPDTLPECGNESEIGVEVHSGMESEFK